LIDGSFNKNGRDRIKRHLACLAWLLGKSLPDVSTSGSPSDENESAA
jgi:hypothetical protein